VGGSVIVTVTLNASLDITYDVERLTPGEVHRVRAVDVRAGGKGINVARTLEALGSRALATGFAGGVTGQQLCDELDRAGIEHDLIPIAGSSRRTVTVTSGGAATPLNEAGPVVSPLEWRQLTRQVARLLAGARALVLAGSLPPGVPQDAYATLVELASRRDVPVLLDADGEALVAGVRARPALAKVNAAEARRATGVEDPDAAANLLRGAGAEAVVITLGAEGMLALAQGNRWRAAPPELVSGNPTGAGDAATAALVQGMLKQLPWPARLARAAAASAAAVAAPAAGELDLERYDRWLRRS
jgi:tagatose 6-phosphate kinase